MVKRNTRHRPVNCRAGGTWMIPLFSVFSIFMHLLFLSDFPIMLDDKITLPMNSSESGSNGTAFGACLMVKDDNRLLYEWLAYHYTVLPLRYLVIGSDLNNSQDPRIVLDRWRTEAPDLKVWILQPGDFINRHSDYNDHFGGGLDFLSTDEERKHHHHALIHRQKGFLTTCAELLQKEGVGWTLFIDTDEFLAMNPITQEDESLQVDGTGHSSITNHSHLVRTIVRDKFLAKRTVMDVIVGMPRHHRLGTCYTMPRLLFGALENATCDSTTIANIQVTAGSLLEGQFQNFSTLRFFQHAKKGDFAASKFGKVMMDLSQLSAEMLKSHVPSNIHRPFRNICDPAGGAHFPNAYFFLAHYIGGWERYASRGSDHRRSYREWLARSVVGGDMSACAAIIPSWFPRFVKDLGDSRNQQRAQFLLGIDG